MLGTALALLAACAERETILTGERLSLRDSVATAEALDAPAPDRAVPISLPAQVAVRDWTHVAAGPDHDRPHASLSPAPRLAFAVPIGQGDGRRHRITTDPVIADGRIFTADSRARVMAHTLNGQPLWSAEMAPTGEPSDDSSGAGLAVSGNRLFVSTAFGQIVALDAATGRRLWAQDLGAAAAGAPTATADTVFVIGRDATAWALDPANGRVKWTAQGTPSTETVGGGASPAVSGDMVVLPFASRELRGLLRAGGSELWSTTVAGTRLGRVYAAIGDITGDPVIVGDTLYAGSPSGRTDAFSLRSGRQLWSAREGAMGPPAVAGGSVFTVSDQNELVRIDATTGERIWAEPLPYFVRNNLRRRRDIYVHHGPLLAGGRLWVASSDGLLRGFSPVSGALEATVELPGGATTNPVVAQGTLFVVNRDGQLLAFR